MTDLDNPWIVFAAVFVLCFAAAAFVYWFENRETVVEKWKIHRAEERNRRWDENLGR